MNYKVYIGLEVHIELKTAKKMFCGCNALYFGKAPNTQCCPVCLGLPGALPVPNKEAIDRLFMVGLAFNCKVNLQSFFDRKNYFYPDLPKGYQISQHYRPFCYEGFLDIKTNNKTKRIQIREIHLEEDTGKLMHSTEATLIDFNRSGVPLMEIVTEPDLETSEEVKEYLKKIQQIVRYLSVSDCDMEKGSMRCEPSISIRRQETGDRRQEIELPDYRVEIKNINSFRFAQKAVEYEIERQKKILISGQKVIQETRGWSEAKNATVSQRTKEVAKDYRYFPEPDIPPIRLKAEEMKTLKERLPELPDEKIARFMKEYGLSEYDSRILCEDKWLAEYFEEVVKVSSLPAGKAGIKHQVLSIRPKQIANLIINKKVDIRKNNPSQLVTIIINSQKKSTVSDEELKKIVEKVIKDNQKAVSDYKNGKQVALMFLIGQVMRETKGMAEAGKVKELLTRLIVPNP